MLFSKWHKILFLRSSSFRHINFQFVLQITIILNAISYFTVFTRIHQFTSLFLCVFVIRLGLCCRTFKKLQNRWCIIHENTAFSVTCTMYIMEYYQSEGFNNRNMFTALQSVQGRVLYINSERTRVLNISNRVRLYKL